MELGADSLLRSTGPSRELCVGCLSNSVYWLLLEVGASAFPAHLSYVRGSFLAPDLSTHGDGNGQDTQCLLSYLMCPWLFRGWQHWMPSQAPTRPLPFPSPKILESIRLVPDFCCVMLGT